MVEIDRRSALTFGIATASTLAVSGPAFATAGPTEGREVAPDVRRIDYGKRESMIPAYKTVGLRDVTYQPGAGSTSPSMANDMVCHMLEGELTVEAGREMKFVAKKGDVWTCVKGMPENARNTGTTVAIMRVTDLMA